MKPPISPTSTPIEPARTAEASADPHGPRPAAAMSLSRRTLLGLGGACLAAAATPVLPARAAKDEFPEPEVGDDGLYKQDWFIDSFLDLAEDHADATKAGKHFAIIWEQRGCPYCRETHRVNFAIPEIRNYIKENFNVLQLDLWGPRKVTDFDGKELEEKALARRWRITGTPTVVFFPMDAKAVTGKNGREAEIWRMLGYWKPFHFYGNFRYVRTGAYKTTHFQRFLSAWREELKKQGKEVKLW